MGRAARVAALEAKLLSTSQGVGVTAAIFALKNADPDEWQDRYYTDTRVNVSIEQMSDEELFEPPRVCRRLFCLSHVATAVSATLA